MAKQKGSFRNALFFLLGTLVYSFFYWQTDHNHAHVFGMILVALACCILCKMKSKKEPKKEWIKTEDVIYMCFGVIFDSLLSSAFPFSLLQYVFFTRN
jgi:hypothetical protein